MNSPALPAGSLDGVRVLDLSRILAGPSCTQLLGDLGADVIKVEKPGAGDDTRKWGPPFARAADGTPLDESAYYLCANRNKRSVALDIATPEGQASIHALLAHSDVLIENFKVGDLSRYGLDWPQLNARYPRLVYCSITGFGQDGPYAARPGYDFMAQAMGGIMSLTGEPDGAPQKVAVGITDLMTGMYATVGILAALRHRDRHGVGQHVDVALLDCQVASLANAATHYLTSGTPPARLGNAHPNIVPYEAFPASDGYFVIAVGNDAQFRRLCTLPGMQPLADDARFITNASRVSHRAALIPLMQAITRERDAAWWRASLEALQIPCAPINTLPQVFADPQVVHRGMAVRMEDARYEAGGPMLLGNPLKLSATPVRYARTPPRLGEHTSEVLGPLATSDLNSLNDPDRHPCSN
ncbi:CaiB/BaiF CoA-transferase family protein [Paraburkholderia fungorum]|uniref:CaiB/BaiF CoA transferase family protein n=1 Tax=Paraburkholderia fungorum TaxID=134537 RepID=UPI0038BCF693